MSSACACVCVCVCVCVSTVSTPHFLHIKGVEVNAGQTATFHCTVNGRPQSNLLLYLQVPIHTPPAPTPDGPGPLINWFTLSAGDWWASGRRQGNQTGEFSSLRGQFWRGEHDEGRLWTLPLHRPIRARSGRVLLCWAHGQTWVFILRFFLFLLYFLNFYFFTLDFPQEKKTNFV